MSLKLLIFPLLHLAGLAFGQVLRGLVGLWGRTKGERGVRDGPPGFSLWILVWSKGPLSQRGPWGVAVSPFPIPRSGPLEMTFLERNMLVIS